MRTYRQVLAEAKAAHNHPTYAKMAFVMGCGVQGGGTGSTVLDDAGQSFLALFDQYGNQSLGYSHPRIIAAIRDQLDSGVLNSTKIMFEEVQIRLTERLAELTDQELPFAYLANGGGETIDNALKLARAATGRPRFISALGCFHGKTFATLGAAARPEHQERLGPLMSEFQQVPFGDLDALAEALDDTVAAVLLEPVQAEAGVVTPPPDYLREVRRLCTEAGALLILDEMQTAFGRCGTFFAYQQYGITPDLICVGKAFGGGMLALSAVVGTEEVWKVLRDLPSTFGSSLGGNPLACRVGLETIDIASDEAFLADIRAKGERITARLAAAAARYPEVIAEHRGIGMMHGLELRDDSLTGLVLGRLIEEGVTSTYSLYNPRVLRVQPPLVISDADLERGLDVLDEVLAEADAARGSVRPTAALSPLTRTVPLARPAEDVVRLLHERPRLLDPFARDTRADPRDSEEDFGGRIGQDEVVWPDRVERGEDGVALRADPCWLWQELARTVVVRPAAGGGCTVDVEIAWDTGSGGYEEMLGGRIALFAEERLTHLLARLEKELENA
ncbi:aspartate aminotransferase family protein [Streptomyces silaceus]|uniref:aspartate aminotransferase family protein n=1 Tax=Streptomyces silaceus TaxID=545123 RepID=UPI0006EB2BC7|nr:aminotransferase class III-fold pyridoxal phosphate-dependent enzyme [Streptomyces silaceus]